MSTYTPIIGLEIHIELATKTGMFCRCPGDHFGKRANTATCPICLGLPGALPYPNKKAIEDTVKIGLALNCTINEFAKFDRKHYFYPDLPKAYQISQYDKPFCQDGKLQIPNDQLPIGITRVHLEEDTGKLRHEKINGKTVSLVDFNRSGVPLVEIVTEPDFRSSEEAVEFAKMLRKIVRYLGVSECDMEKGSMRLEANVSVSGSEEQKAKRLPGYKVELKNINSFRFMQKAIEIEIKRQAVILASGGTLSSETRGYDENKNVTFLQRSKEEAKDYRYFPEPDIPPIRLSQSVIQKWKEEIPELPGQKAKRFVSDYQVPIHYVDKITEELKTANYFEDVLKYAQSQKVETKTVLNEILNKGVDITKVDTKKFISDLALKKISQISDAKALQAWVDEAVTGLPQAVENYKKGNINAIMALVGRVMALTKGSADPKLTRELLEKTLS